MKEAAQLWIQAWSLALNKLLTSADIAYAHGIRPTGDIGYYLTGPDGWTSELRLEAGNKASYVVLNNQQFTTSAVSSKLLTRLLKQIVEHRIDYDAKRLLLRSAEAEAAKWTEQQARDLKGLPEERGVTASIIRHGSYAGLYHVNLDSYRNPLQCLTVKQVKAFYTFLKTLRRS
jgi:hypothetical protein